MPCLRFQGSGLRLVSDCVRASALALKNSHMPVLTHGSLSLGKLPLSNGLARLSCNPVPRIMDPLPITISKLDLGGIFILWEGEIILNPPP